VQSGRFGACLMAEPSLVAECVAAMGEATDRPVTVKHRIGIDDRDSYEELAGFVERVAAAGCGTFIVHARKAWLQGLSPKENREIPPLSYDTVYRLKADFPRLQIVINGGICSLDEVSGHLAHVDGAMIGREAYNNPWVLAAADRRIFGDPRGPADPRAVVLRMHDYTARELPLGTPLHHITRHMLGLFAGMPGARAWRRHLSEHANRPGADWQTLLDAMALVRS
jgi:tRNA-dihydrouridine synthase A